MTATAIRTTDAVTEPTEPGWYASAADGLGDYLIYLRLADIDVPGVFTRSGQWMAFNRDGVSTKCAWAYIAQAGPLTRLLKEN